MDLPSSALTSWQHALAVLRAPFEPRDPDHFAGPGFPQQEPDLVAEQRGG